MVQLSVILPTYNAEKYLKEAVESILNQTFTDFELLIIDDNSTDKTREIINTYDDKRIRLINGPRKNLAAALNTGIKESKGEYIARMDADDISFPERFEEQLKTFKEHPEIDILGTKAELLSQKKCKDKYFLQFFYEDKPEVFYIGAVNVLNTCVFCHPTVMFKREIFDKYNLFYDENYTAGEDQELWTRAVLMTKLAVLNKPLLKYRIHNTNLTDKICDLGLKLTRDAKIKLLNTLLPYNKANLKSLQNLESESYKINEAINTMISENKPFDETVKTTLAEKIFSSKNIYTLRGKRKILTLFGIKFKFKVKSDRETDIIDKTSEIEQLFYSTINFVPVKDKKIFLFGTSRHNNIGDAAIAEAEIKFAEKYFPEYQIIEFSTWEFDNNLKYLKYVMTPYDMIWCSGGGNFGNRYLGEEELRRKVVQNFPQNPIFIFPQSIFFTEDRQGLKEIAISRKIYESHPNVTIMNRDPKSLEYAKEYFPNTKSFLFPDIVCSYPYNKNFEREGVLCCIRDVGDESAMNEEQYNQVMNFTKNLNIPVDYTKNLYSESYISKFKRNYIVEEQLNNFAKHKFVITDRLHGLIFSIITKTPCIAIKSQDHKLKEFLNFLKDCKSIIYIDTDIDKLADAAKKIQTISDTDYPEWQKQFDNMFEMIKNERGIK